MRKQIKILKKAAALFIVLMLLCSTVAVGLTASAATITNPNDDKTYDIAVVFDNSGSMYYKETYWCQAKYAMEIFASMLNYENGDRLTIFPMWAVETDGEQPKTPENKNEQEIVRAQVEPIKVTNIADIDKIKNMHTIDAHETPFAPIDEAHSYLKKSSASVKWLIVMTDGVFNMNTRADKIPEGENDYIDKSPDEVKSFLNGKVSDGIKVQYLGFGAAADFDGVEDKRFDSLNADANIRKGLINICNKIFERSVLDDDYYDEEDGKIELELDISMGKLIVFVQGEGATVKSLKNSEGTEILPTNNSGKRESNTIGCGNPWFNNSYFDKMAGQVVTFGECAAGEYTLDCDIDDNTEIQIFYEPDVDIRIEFVNSEGVAITSENGEAIELVEGEYTIRTSVIDRVTKKDVTGHELLGIKDLTTEYKIGDEEEYTLYEKYGGEKGKVITFEPDTVIGVRINGEYLNGIEIKTEESKDFDWLKGIKINLQPVNFKLDATVLQEKNTYVHMSDDEWDPIKVVFSLEGQPLTAEELANVKLDLRFNSELKYRTEMKESESACYIYIDENKSESLKPVGEYELTVSAEYTNERGRATPAGDEVEFKLQEIEKWIIDLLWILIVLAVITVITLWLIHPVLPKKVIISEGNFTKNATIKGNFNMPSRYDMRCVPVSGKARVVAKSRNFWIMSKLKPKRMTFRITDVHTSGVGEFTCDGITYTCESGALYDSAGEKVESMIIGNSSVSWDENNGGYFEGSLHINKR